MIKHYRDHKIVWTTGKSGSEISLNGYRWRTTIKGKTEFFHSLHDAKQAIDYEVEALEKE